MKRYLLLTPVLAMAAVLSTGCADSGTIRAQTPGGSTYTQAGVTQNAGQYALFHVTSFDEWGAPVTTEKLDTLTLGANVPVGFQFIVPKDRQYDPDAQSDIIAYAGSFRRNLGPVHSIDEKYFWAIPGEWDGYWSGRPERVLTKRLTMN